MLKHQATTPTTRLTRNEQLAPGFIATLNADGDVIAVHSYGMYGDLSPEQNTALRFNDQN
jgi:hypothetical protein